MCALRRAARPTKHAAVSDRNSDISPNGLWPRAISKWVSRIGYLPEARVHHYYIGSLADLKAFTLDFVQGEIRYFSEDRRKRDSFLLDVPPELICQDNFNRGMARAILRMVARDMLTSPAAEGGSKQAIWALGRWASPAIFGDGLVRAEAAAVAVYAYLDMALAAAIGSRQRLGVAFKRFIAALIRSERLRCVRAERLSRVAKRGTP